MGNLWPVTNSEQVCIDEQKQKAIISYWLILNKFNVERNQFEDICDIILVYLKYFRLKKHEWFELSNDNQKCKKVISSKAALVHERDSYPEIAGILFGDIVQNRYYSNYQFVIKIDKLHNYKPIGINLIDKSHLYAKFGAPVGSFKVQNSEIPCTIWLHSNVYIKVTVDSKLKTLTVTNMENSNKKVIQYAKFNINQPQLCFFANNKNTTFEIMDQIWYK
eukprot:162977_1